jgi:hypothetical protein
VVDFRFRNLYGSDHSAVHLDATIVTLAALGAATEDAALATLGAATVSSWTAALASAASAASSTVRTTAPCGSHNGVDSQRIGIGLQSGGC